MKNFILALLILVVCVPVNAETASEKEYKKLISKYDVPRAAREISGEDGNTTFWHELVKNNHRVDEIKKAIEQNRWTDKEVRKNINIKNKFHAIKDSLIADGNYEDFTQYQSKL